MVTEWEKDALETLIKWRNPEFSSIYFKQFPWDYKAAISFLIEESCLAVLSRSMSCLNQNLSYFKKANIFIPFVSCIQLLFQEVSIEYLTIHPSNDPMCSCFLLVTCYF